MTIALSTNRCSVSQRLEASGRVITTLEWLRLHRDHGDIEERPAQHPSGATDYKRSSRDTYLQRLSARRLIVAGTRGEVRASDTLFE